VFAVATVCHAVSATPANSQSGTLRDLDSVAVVVHVQGVAEMARRAGLDVDRVRTRMELELRRTGLGIKAAAEPPLVVAAFMVIEVPGGFAYTVSLALVDHVYRIVKLAELAGELDAQVHLGLRDYVSPGDFLGDASSYGGAGIIWDRSNLGFAPLDAASADIMEMLTRFLEDFFSDYLAANPRE
jgi:hypothetical protein